MAAITWHMTNSLASVHQEMSETAGGANGQTSPATGWIVSNVSGNHSALDSQVERAASTFTSTTPPSGTIDTTNGDCLRSTNTYTGSFASGNWVAAFKVAADTNGGAQDGRIRLRLLRGSNADGSGATEITAAQQQGTVVTDLTNAAVQTSTVTWNPGAFSVSSEYIFLQIAWERTGAGGMTSSDVLLRVGAAGNVSNTNIVSADFTATTPTSYPPFRPPPRFLRRK